MISGVEVQYSPMKLNGKCISDISDVSRGAMLVDNRARTSETCRCETVESHHIVMGDFRCRRLMRSSSDGMHCNLINRGADDPNHAIGLKGKL